MTRVRIDQTVLGDLGSGPLRPGASQNVTQSTGKRCTECPAGGEKSTEGLGGKTLHFDQVNVGTMWQDARAPVKEKKTEPG